MENTLVNPGFVLRRKAFTDSKGKPLVIMVPFNMTADGYPDHYPVETQLFTNNFRHVIAFKICLN